MAKWEEDNLGQAHSTYGLHKAQHSWQISCSLPLHQTFNWKIRLFTRLMSPILAKEMPLSSQPHLMHITAFWTTVVHNCFQGGSAVKTKPHPKSLKNTLRSHWEWLPPKQTHALVSQSHTSHKFYGFAGLLSMF